MRSPQPAVAIISALLLLAVVLPSTASAATYYVAPSGNDSYNGLAPAYTSGSNGPFRTLGRASGQVRAGDTVQIRAGIYREQTYWRSSGTEASPITITNYDGEAVVIDGNANTLPADNYAFLMEISGDWCVVSNLEVCYSGGVGIGVDGGVHDTLRNITAHHNYRTGIHGGGDYCLVDGCRVYWNSTIYEYGRGDAWSSGIALGRDCRHTIARNNRVWNNWGQGLNAGFDSVIEDNTSWDNMCSFYVNDAQGVLFQRNLAYVTPGNVLEPYVAFQAAILVGDERDVPSRGNVFINNVAMGGMYVLSLGSGALEDCVVANNTLINAYNPAGAAYALRIGKGAYTNVLFENNVVIQDTAASIAACSATGITFGFNIWSKAPTSGVRGPGDLVADPRIAKTGPVGPGALSADYFKILSDSPARDAAAPVAAVIDDYFRAPRGPLPDIGACEISDGSSPLAAAAAGAPTAGDLPLPVSFTGRASGGQAPYAYHWAFGDGGSAETANASHTYSSAGLYTATLTVTDSARASASSSVGVNVTAGLPLNAAIAVSSSSGEAPLAVAFSGRASGGEPPYAYRWVFGDGGSSSAQNPAHSYASAGAYTAMLTVTDAASSSAFSTVEIDVAAPPPGLDAAIGVSAASGPAPLVVSFTGRVNGGAPPYACHWAFGDGSTSTEQDPSHKYARPGSYVVVLTISDQKSARASAAAAITVEPRERRLKQGPKDRVR